MRRKNKFAGRVPELLLDFPAWCRRHGFAGYEDDAFSGWCAERAVWAAEYGWPSGDVALQVAMLSLFGLESRPDRKTMEKMAEPWRPWRSVAARLLWMHYRKVKTGELVEANSFAPFTALLHKI